LIEAYFFFLSTSGFFFGNVFSHTVFMACRGISQEIKEIALKISQKGLQDEQIEQDLGIGCAMR
jgi:hypothetical protein